ncbi:spore germination lipoprotein GerD [Bacillus cihuensis]|uniref:spore germination lipoprotein GerD n=1 Tax=Bacillus cihuensis TaxID=1208599 RepID=UPI000404B014|nr:spore germination lipoprotein GerD [Bacillus cihuensis]
MRYSVILLLFSMFCLVGSGCTQSGTSVAKMDYEETKKMVVDILKTDDGKKAIQDVLSDESIKSKLILDQDVVTKAVETTITSDKGQKFWENSFKDPKFAANYAKSLKKEHEQLLKDLAKDPNYREMITDIMKEPGFQTEINKLLKSNEIRSIYKETLLETMDSPLVKAKMQDILIKAATKMQTDEKSNDKKKGSGGDTGSGGGGS